MGGPSAERKISLATGKNIIAALDARKYSVRPVIIPKNGGLPALPKADVAFIAMHGKYGEDGTIQAILEALKIPYTGSGVLASALGMDKPRASAVFAAAGLTVPEFLLITKKDFKRGVRLNAIIKRLRFPMVTKPADQGSSVGTSIVKNAHELKQGIREALRYSDRAIIQKFIRGREITCGVLETHPRPTQTEFGSVLPLPPIEIRPQKGKFYDYRSKYEDGGSEHIIPPPGLSKRTIKMIQNAACRAHQVIGCSGMSRSDFILGEDGRLYILEINTIPGMTKTSLLPEAAKAAGLDFSKLVDTIINTALCRSKRRK